MTVANHKNISDSEGRRIEIKEIKTSAIFVPETYQREQRQGRINKMVKAANEHLFQPIEVSSRAGGKYAAMDGGHRLEMAIKQGRKTILCRVHYGLNEAEESYLFRHFQLGRLSLPFINQLPGMVLEGDPIAAMIYAYADRYGYTIDGNGGEKAIKAAGSLYKLAEMRGEEVLDRTLDILHAWLGGRAPKGMFIEGVGFFTYLAVKSNQKIDWDYLKRTLEAQEPSKFLSVVKSRTGGSSYGGKSSFSEFARLMADVYNVKKRSNKIVMAPTVNGGWAIESLRLVRQAEDDLPELPRLKSLMEGQS